MQGTVGPAPIRVCSTAPYSQELWWLLAGSLQPGKRGPFANSAANVLFVPVEGKFPMIRMQTRQVSRSPLLLCRPCICMLT